MAKMVAPDRGAREVDVRTERGTTRYSQNRQGLIEVDNPRHAAQMKAEGFFEASLMGVSTTPGVGHVCLACGFSAWFKICGRCGAENE